MAPEDVDHKELLDALDVAVVAYAPVRDAAGAIQDFTWEYANAMSLAAANVRWEDVAGRTLGETMPDRGALRLESFIEVYESDVPLAIEMSAPIDGTDRWLETHVRRLGDLLVVRFDDVTERRRLAVERTEALATVEQVLGRISDAMFAVDREWRFTLVNRSAERLLGRAADELIGRSLWEEFPHAVGTTFEASYRHAVATGEPVSFDQYYPAPLDSWYRARAYPDAEGLTVHFADVGVEHRVEERAAHFDRLEAVTRLAGGVAHDFNNLLMVVSGHTSFLADDLPADHPSQEDVQAIALAAERAAALTRQLLSYTSQQVVNPQPIDLNEALVAAQVDLERRLPDTVTLHLHPMPTAAMVQIDPLELDRLVGHLVDNAGQAIDGVGRVVVEVVTAEVDDEVAALFPGREPGSYVVLAVSDDGHGMSPLVVDRAVEPFFTTRRAAGAVGLGLSAVHGITRQAGGHVVIYSEPGHGTTVRVFLHRTGAVAPETPTGVGDTRGTESVLVVDDNADVAGLVERSLHGAGYSVEVVGGGREALERLRAPGSAFALLVTDVAMPEMNGVELARAARAEVGPLPVLFVSGYTANTIADGSSLEHAEFLAKPFRRSDLLERVRRLLDRGDGA